MGQPVLFQKWAPVLMAKLMADFDMSVEDAAAVLGNWGLESGGFRSMQELNPTSGRGGLGIAQWTGPRRINYERWLQRTGTSPTDFNSSYAFAWRELTGQPGESNESRAIPMVKNAVGLENKVKAFELGFERAGVKHYPERLAWAKIALAAYAANPVKVAKEEPVATVLPVPQVVKSDFKAKGTWAAILTGLAGTVGTVLAARNPVLGATWESLAPYLIAGVTTVGGAVFSYLARRTAQGPLASAPVAKQEAAVLSPVPFALPEEPPQVVQVPSAPPTAILLANGIANGLALYDQIRPLVNLASPFIKRETPLGKIVAALPEIDKQLATIRASLERGSQGGSTS